MEGGPKIALIPHEFSNMLVNTSKDIAGESIENEGAYSIFELDTDYLYRNVPLDIYTQYNINLSKVKIFSKSKYNN